VTHKLNMATVLRDLADGIEASHDREEWKARAERAEKNEEIYKNLFHVMLGRQEDREVRITNDDIDNIPPVSASYSSRTGAGIFTVMNKSW
jgi:hypothetical protein